jgi:hypothetical protein
LSEDDNVPKDVFGTVDLSLFKIHFVLRKIMEGSRTDGLNDSGRPSFEFTLTNLPILIFDVGQLN